MVASNIYFNGKHTAVGGLRWMHSDHLGTPRMKVDNNAQVVSRDWYYPFGEQINIPADNIQYKFTGKERDAESALDYFGARYYSPAQGRFTSPDPENAGALADDPQSWNGYAYARNNPLLYTDPTGKRFTICDVNGDCLENYSDEDFAKNFRKAKDVRLTKNEIFVKDTEGKERLIGTYERTSVDLRPEAVEIFSRVEQLAGPTVRGLFGATMAFVYLAGPAMISRGPTTAATLGLSGTAVRISFQHGARHLAGTGLLQSEVEAAIQAQVAELASQSFATGGFWGNVVVRGQTIVYRAYTVAKDVINIGTYYPVR